MIYNMLIKNNYLFCINLNVENCDLLVKTQHATSLNVANIMKNLYRRTIGTFLI